MPEHFTAGTVLNDVHKNPWCLGTPIGQGGFGVIYIGKIVLIKFFMTMSEY